MQLSLLRFAMIVPLLVSAVRIEESGEKFPSVRSRRDRSSSIVELPVRDQFSRNELISVDNLDQDRDTIHGRRSRSNLGAKKRQAKVRRGRMNDSSGNRVTRSGNQELAKKFAKEALKSAKVQDTIRKLSRVPTSQRNLYDSAKVPVVATRNSAAKSSTGLHHKLTSRKGREKKRKRNHRRFRNHQSSWPKGGPSKETSGTTKNADTINTTAGKTSANGKSILKRKHSVHENKTIEKALSKPNKKIHAVNIVLNDYTDFSTTETSASSTTIKKDNGTVDRHGNESMIERLMRTTTSDPSRKNPVDQGIEYSDYYSDDVLEDIAANKIQMKIAEPNDRFTRETLNASLFDNDYPMGDAQVYPQDYNQYGRNVDYDESMMSRNNYQNFPVFDQSRFNQNSRLSAVDDTSYNYAPNYIYPVDTNENIDNQYPVNVEEIPASDEPETFQQVTASDLQNDFELSRANKYNEVIQAPVDELPRYPSNFNYFNPNEGQSFDDEARVRNPSLFDSGIPGNLIPQIENRYASPQVQNSERNIHNFINYNPTAEEPRFSENSNVPQLRNQLANYDQGAIVRYPAASGREEDRENEANFRASLNSGKQDLSQFSNNRYGTQEEQQNLKSFSLQPAISPSDTNLPAINLPNAMEQPFGKVLESLGINVDAISGNQSLNPDTRKNVNLVATANGPTRKLSPNLPSRTIEQPAERILSPSYIRKELKEDLNRNHGENSLPLSDVQTGTQGDENLRNNSEERVVNSNVEQQHPRRQLTRSGSKIRNELSELMDQDGNINTSGEMNETKVVANQILGTIMDELEELKLDHSKNNKKEGLPCRLTGSWSTAQAGMKLDMKVVNRTITVTLTDCSSPRYRESLLNGTWNVTGHVPFRRGAPFTLTATDNHTKSMAVFVGACRVCHGIDTIAGVWSVARQPKDCKDFQVATSVFNDIFRKTKLSTLKQLGQDNTNSSNGDTMIDGNKKRSG